MSVRLFLVRVCVFLYVAPPLRRIRRESGVHCCFIIVWRRARSRGGAIGDGLDIVQRVYDLEESVESHQELTRRVRAIEDTHNEPAWSPEVWESDLHRIWAAVNRLEELIAGDTVVLPAH